MQEDGQHQFLIAGGSVDITPPNPVPLASYRAVRKAVFDTIVDELEANVLVLRTGTETPAVFVSVDLLYAGAYLCNRIFEALAGRVSRERILVAASHTHFAPATEESLPALGTVAHQYLDFAATRVIDLVKQLLDAPAVAAACRYHEGAAHHSVNRRRARFGIRKRYPYIGFHTEIAPNEEGPRDDLIRAMTLTASDGRVAAIGWSYACHPNTFPSFDVVSAEYPGRVRQFLRRRFGPIPVLFWQGFSGNINPYRNAESGGELAHPPAFVAATMSQWERWAESLSEAVQQTVSTAGRPIGGRITCQVRSMSVRELGLRSDKRLTYQQVALGRDLAVCALSAEVAVEYVDRLRAALPCAAIIPVGCAEDVFGYLPVDEMISGGGYEVRGFLRRFGLRGKFRRDVGGIVERRLLAREDGPPA